MSFLEVNVESIFIARVCLGLAGLTHAGHWGAHCLRLVGLMRVVRLFGFDFGRRAPRGCEASARLGVTSNSLTVLLYAVCFLAIRYSSVYLACPIVYFY